MSIKTAFKNHFTARFYLLGDHGDVHGVVILWFAAESGAVAEFEIAAGLHASGGQMFADDAQGDDAVEAFGVEAIDQQARE